GVAAGNVFDNDTDADGVFVKGVLVKANWTAVLVTPPAHGSVVLQPNGAFAYSGCGADSFRYRVNTGTWRDTALPMRDDSNVATVNVNIPCLALVGVLNVPPAKTKVTVKSGGSVPMQWQFTNGSVVVDSEFVVHTITVRGPLPAGPTRLAGDSGSSYL